MAATTTAPRTLAEQIEAANASDRTPVVFVHGLWLLPNSWDNWAERFEQEGFAPLTPGWPGDPATVAEAKAHPEVLAGKSVGQIADHFEAVIRELEIRPAIIGHSFGGLLTEILAGRGLAAASVAISPAPFRGILQVPLATLKSSRPVLSNPANRNRAVGLTPEQFRYGFGNVVSEEESQALYEQYSVPGPGKPVFQAVAANLNPRTEVKVDTRNPARGPMLIITADDDHTVPAVLARAAYKKQLRNPGVTELVEMQHRGHALTVDHGWSEVADTALAFVERFATPEA